MMNTLNLTKHNIYNGLRASLAIAAGAAALTGCAEDGSSGAGFTESDAGSYGVTVPNTATVDPSRAFVSEDGSYVSIGFINEANQPQIDFVGSLEDFTDEDCGTIVFPVKEDDNDKPQNFQVEGIIGQEWTGSNGKSCVYPGAENYLADDSKAAEENRKAALQAIDTISADVVQSVEGY